VCVGGEDEHEARTHIYVSCQIRVHQILQFVQFFFIKKTCDHCGLKNTSKQKIITKKKTKKLQSTKQTKKEESKSDILLRLCLLCIVIIPSIYLSYYCTTCVTLLFNTVPAAVRCIFLFCFDKLNTLLKVNNKLM
jgi:hypothetical protein